LHAAGSRYALKELFWDADQDEHEIRYRTAFETAARIAGVRCPESLPTVAGDYLCRLPPESGGAYVRLYSWVDGAPLTSVEGAEGWLGGTLGRLHRLRHEAAGPPDPSSQSVPTVAQWAELLSALRTDGVRWADGLERLLPRIGDLASLVAPADPDELITCHLDLTPANVMRTGSGFVLVDWDNAGPGCAEQELAAALMAWHGARPAGIAATMAAYAEAGGTATLRGLPSFSAYVATVINNLHTQASVAVAPHLHREHRTLATIRALRVMASLPTRSTLEQVGDLAVAQLVTNCRGGTFR
jgi:Ser/Thr protein kinase RdoA (MazF antagonist)